MRRFHPGGGGAMVSSDCGVKNSKLSRSAETNFCTKYVDIWPRNFQWGVPSDYWDHSSASGDGDVVSR